MFLLGVIFSPRPLRYSPLMAEKNKLTRLFEPVEIGSMSLKNRIVMPAMQNSYATPDGFVTSRMKEFFLRRAKGGAGLITVAMACVDSPVGKGYNNQVCIDDDKFIPGLKEFVDIIKAEGACVMLQLNHVGGQFGMAVKKGMRPVAPSSIPYPTASGYEIPRELTTEEVGDIIGKFADAALRAKEAGFDAVEHHTCIVQQFLSPRTNRRTDLYGKEKSKFLLDIIEKVKHRVGGNFPQMVKMYGDEYIHGGLTLRAGIRLARRLEDSGVAAIHLISPNTPRLPFFEVATRKWSVTTSPVYCPPAHNVPLCEIYKKHVNIAIVAAGRINDPILAESILKQEKADLIAFGRALIADPEMPIKASAGKFAEIRPCIGCMQCHHAISQNEPLLCTVQPTLGNENELEITAAKKKKKIMIAGGGPAGMEAARVLAVRGHDVTLYERSPQLGGQLVLASRVRGKDVVEKLKNYLENQIRKLGVEVITGVELTPDIVREGNPDVVVVATGANQLIPKIEGVDGRNVRLAWAVLSGAANTGRRIVVLGGGLVGAETALYLAEKGKQVAIVEMLNDIAPGEAANSRFSLMARLRKDGVRIFTRSFVDKITTKGVVFSTHWYTKRRNDEADTVVLAVGSRPNWQLASDLEGIVPEIYRIGDCCSPRKTLNAIHEAFELALKI